MRNPDVIGDTWGGLAAMLVALPSAIAFGVAIYSPLGETLAAEGAVAGILGTIALGLVAPLLGGSARLVTAPSAPAAAVLSSLAMEFASQGMTAATVLLLLSLIGLMTGILQVGLGAARIGRLMRYVPFPVGIGYLCGVGLIIIGSQLPRFMGAPAGTNLMAALRTPALWDWRSMVVGGVVAAAMVLMPRLTRAVPATILALLAGIATYLVLGHFDSAMMRVDETPLLIGPLPAAGAGLVDLMVRHWRPVTGLGLDSVLKVLVPSLTLAVLLSIDTLKTCLVVDTMTSTQHESNRELVGQGLGNVTAALVGGIPGSGTMGASMVNIASGGSTKLSGLLVGVFSLAGYLLLARLVAWVPVAALAAILIVIGVRMVDVRSLAFFFTRSTRLDFLVIVAVVLVAIFGNLIAASGVGVALAILLFIREQTRSSVVRHRIEGSEIFSKRSRPRQDIDLLVREGGDTVVFELQGSLFFGTASQLFGALEPEARIRKYVILSMRRVQSLDVTATHILEQVKDLLEEHDAYLVFCDIPKGLPSGLKMKRFLKETRVVRPTNKAIAFHSLDEALEWVEERKLGRDQVDGGDAPPLGLRDMPLFAGCSEDDFAALEVIVEPHTVRAEKRVFKAGAGDQSLFLIRRGQVKVLVPMARKEHYHLATSGPGDIVGGMGFFEGLGHVADAVALTETEVYALPRHRFDALIAQHPKAALAIIEAVAHGLSTRLRATIGELQALRD